MKSEKREEYREGFNDGVSITKDTQLRHFVYALLAMYSPAQIKATVDDLKGVGQWKEVRKNTSM